MRLLLAGGRFFDDVDRIRRALDTAHAVGPAEVIIHGGAGVLGVAAEDWAREQRLDVVRYPANWREFGKRADGIRNAFMLADGRPDLVLALPGGRDTRALVAQALGAGLTVIDGDGQPIPANETDPRPEPGGSAMPRPPASVH